MTNKSKEENEGKKLIELFFYTHKDGAVTGFYSNAVGVVPEGASPISAEGRQEALGLQSDGKVLVVLDGRIVGADPTVNAERDAKAFVQYEMGLADVQINYHDDDDERAELTVGAWRSYRKALRGYTDKHGAIHGERPQRPA